jgi:hypothetical protein
MTIGTMVTSLWLSSATLCRTAISSSARRFASMRTWEYRESMARETCRRCSTLLADPVFSALGGWAKQRAVFLNNLITINSHVEMARVSTISVEIPGRVGRRQCPALRFGSGFGLFDQGSPHGSEGSVGSLLQTKPPRDACACSLESISQSSSGGISDSQAGQFWLGAQNTSLL